MKGKWILAMCAMALAACSTPVAVPTAAESSTDYQPNGIYILQRDVFLGDNGFSFFSSIDNPRYFLSEKAENQNVALIPRRSAIQYKKIWHGRNLEVGTKVEPVGVLLDRPHSGTPVMLGSISKNADLADNSTNPRFVNPKFLKITGKRKPKEF